MEKVLSVSVAAYNLGSMIEQCLNSFIQEDILGRVEVLVTDDGSKDNTAEIVENYEKKYPGTFRLIRQKNAGPGSTVNSGLTHATGKYFRMVDGDDWVNTKEMKAYLDYLESHETDMVCTNYCCVDHETGEQQKQILNVNTWGHGIEGCGGESSSGDAQCDIPYTDFERTSRSAGSWLLYRCRVSDASDAIYPDCGIPERDHLYVSGISVHAEYEYQESSAE